MTETLERLHKQNIDRIEEAFYAGCKSAHTRNLGVELEHFIVKKDTQEAVSYEEKKGVHYILDRLLEIYPNAKAVYAKGSGGDGRANILSGISTDCFSLSLEPAAQLEISISPREYIADIETIYRDFRERLDVVLEDCRAECVTAGYHPHARAEELTLIPKERYHVMDAYFAKIGTGGREMMRATASTQISIDYMSCDDFRKKFQAGYILTPIFKFLTDHTAVYEGKENKLLLQRSRIWDRVDKARTGIVPGAVSGEFTFRSYAEYLWNMPLVYCPKEYMPPSFLRGKQWKEGTMEMDAANVGSLTPAQIWKQETISKEAVWHIMSMAFPDVRLKNYIEIRGMDSMPSDQMLGYAALVKGLMYAPEVIDAIDHEIQIGTISEEQIRRAERAIQREGRKAYVYGKQLMDVCRRLFKKAPEYLPKAEQKYLESISGKFWSQ